MSSAIAELQRDALDRSVELSDLLRRCYVIAKKLKLDEFGQWVHAELNGYLESEKQVPPYRVTWGEVRLWNPYHGWQPVVFGSPEEAKAVSRRWTVQSVAELEDLLSTESSELHMPLPQKTQRQLSSGVGFETRFSVFVPRQGLVKILDAVRNAILRWALQLEEEGIVGEGLTFSETERASVAASPAQNVTNFYGGVGQASLVQPGRDSITVSADIDLSRLEELLGRLTEELETLGVPQEAAREIEADINTLRAQMDSPNPKHGIMRESLASVRKILEGAGGGVASHLAVEIGKLVLGG